MVTPVMSPSVPVLPIKQEMYFAWGPKKGKSCKNATAEDIRSCLQAKPKPPGKPGAISNCQTDCYNAASGCCLGGFNPATALPVITTTY